MKAAYCEIKRGRNCVTVNYYSKEGYGLELGCRKLERERREAYAAKRRRLNRIRALVCWDFCCFSVREELRKFP